MNDADETTDHPRRRSPTISTVARIALRTLLFVGGFLVAYLLLTLSAHRAYAADRPPPIPHAIPISAVPPVAPTISAALPRHPTVSSPGTHPPDPAQPARKAVQAVLGHTQPILQPVVGVTQPILQPILGNVAQPILGGGRPVSGATPPDAALPEVAPEVAVPGVMPPGVMPPGVGPGARALGVALPAPPPVPVIRATSTGSAAGAPGATGASRRGTPPPAPANQRLGLAALDRTGHHAAPQPGLSGRTGWRPVVRAEAGPLPADRSRPGRAIGPYQSPG